MSIMKIQNFTKQINDVTTIDHLDIRMAKRGNIL
jgi:hypothetical protein